MCSLRRRSRCRNSTSPTPKASAPPMNLACVTAPRLRRRWGDERVPDALQRSSRCCAEPGPYQALALVTAPALQRIASQELRAAASGERSLVLAAVAYDIDRAGQYLIRE